MISFWSKVKWRFININAMFERVVGPRLHTLLVYCNAGDSVMVGGRKVDLLQDVKYDLQGTRRRFSKRSTNVFTPCVNAPWKSSKWV